VFNESWLNDGSIANTLSITLAGDNFAGTNGQDLVATDATIIHYLGIMPPALFKQPPSPWETRHQIRFALGAGCDPSLHGAFEQRFGFPLVEVWGMTETGRFIANHTDPRLTDTRAFGRVPAPLQARVVDEHDADVAAEAPGELLLRTEGVLPRQGFFSGYLYDEAATAQAWRGDWFHTGDVVSRDEQGMLFFVDRKKDMVRRSGENISSAEVEAVLAVHAAVLRVAVVAVPDAALPAVMPLHLIPPAPPHGGAASGPAAREGGKGANRVRARAPTPSATGHEPGRGAPRIPGFENDNSIPPTDTLGVMLGAFADRLADLIAVRLSRSNAEPFRPLAHAADSLGMTPRHLREFCDEHSVAIAGTRKAPLVDAAALAQAIASTARVRPRTGDADLREEEHPNEVSDEAIFAANHARRKTVR
ncbi:MAG: AMP-binding protein, partial [Deltaproteobacteria bacterium]